MSRFGQMHWLNRLERLSQAGAIPKGQYGATLDLATAPWSVAAIPLAAPPSPQQNVAQEMAANPLSLRSLEAQQNLIAAPQAVGEAPEGESMASQLFGFGEPVFSALAWAYRELSSEVVSPMQHLLLMSSDKDWYEEVGTNGLVNMYMDGRTWKEAWRRGEEESWGRALTHNALNIKDGLTGDFRLRTHDDRVRRAGSGMLDMGTPDDPRDDIVYRDKDQSKRFDLTSGGIDFMGVMFLDPLWVGGKYVSSTRLLRTTKKSAPVIAKADDMDEVMGSEPVARFLNWTNGRKPEEIERHSALHGVPQAGLIAHLLSKASMKDKDLIYRVSLGDAKAFGELQQTAPAVAAQYARMKGQHRYYELEVLPTLGLSKAEQKAIRKDLKADRRDFRDTNRTQLKLANTEFIPDGAPFSPRWLPQGDSRVYNTFATIYRSLPGEKRKLFSPSGQIERTADEIEASMRQFSEFQDAARTLTSQLGQDVSKQARKQSKRHQAPRLGDLSERTLDPRRYRGQESLTSHIADEIAGETATVRGINAQMRAGLPVGIRGSAKEQAARLQGERVAPLERIGNLRSSRAALRQRQQVEPSYQQWWHGQLETYNPAPASEFAAKMSQQLDLLDDWVTPELTQLNSEGAFWTRVMDDAADIAVTPTKTGIFDQVAELPKGGAYATIAEKKAEFGHKVAMATQRRGSGALFHGGWLSRPVYVATGLKEGLTRGNTPSTFSMGNPEGWRTIDAWLKRVRGLPAETRMEWVRKFMGATDEPRKLQLVEQMEGSIVKHLLLTHGVGNDATIERIVGATLGSKKAVLGRMADEAKTAAEKKAPRGSEEGFTAVRPATLAADGTAIVPGPQLLTQLANEHPLLDVDLLDKAMRRDRGVLQKMGSGTVSNALGNGLVNLGRYWKLSVLFRAGYTIRTVSDEVLLAASALGSWMYFAGAIPGTGRLLASQPARYRNIKTRIENRKASNSRHLPEGELEQVPYQRGMAPVEVSPGNFSFGLYDGPTGNVTRALTSADQRSLYSIHDDLLTALRERMNWGVLNPKDTTKELDWLAAMEHALNRQLGRDVVARKFLRGETEEEVLAWTKSPEGRAYMKRMPLAAGNREDWLRGVAATVDQYTLGDPDLMKLALEGRVTTKKLREIPMERRMPVHGGQLEFSLGTGELNDLFNSMASGFYTIASKLPTDALVRHPVADMLYQSRLRELVAVQEAQGINIAARPDRLYQLEEVARQYTVKEVNRIFKDHLFGSPQMAMGFAMPFFGAWRAGIARWATQVGENPWIVARAQQGWQGLHKPFDVVDENGVPVEDAGDDIYGFDSKHKIVVRLPEKAAKALGAIPFVGDDTEQFAPGRAIPLRSFNTVLQGDPWYNAGFGPFVTVPIAEIVRNRPKAAEFMEKAGVLPFGARDNMTQHLAPTTWQRFMQEKEGLENREYVGTVYNILRVETARYQRGERKNEPKMKEIYQKANDLTKLRVFEAFMSPVSTQPMFYAKEWETNAPKEWQFLAGKLRDYKSRFGNEQGEAIFLEETPEAFLYMQATSENNSGIPANHESWAKARKFKDLASVAPDIFDSAVGIQDHEYGKFDGAVYDAQMSETWNPDTGQKYREMRDPSTMVEEAKMGQTWRSYGKVMDYLRAQLAERKLLTFNDPGAEDLKSKKKQVVDYLSEKDPAWGRAYGTPNPERAHRIREQARLVANDQRLQSDPHRTGELSTLRQYLVVRDWFTKQLAARDLQGGSKALDAQANRDLYEKWDKVRDYLAEKNTRFSEIWLDRYFANDYIQESQ